MCEWLLQCWDCLFVNFLQKHSRNDVHIISTTTSTRFMIIVETRHGTSLQYHNENSTTKQFYKLLDIVFQFAVCRAVVYETL